METQTTICERCQQAQREVCEAGFILVAEGQPGQADTYARCKQWEAHIQANRHAAGLSAAGLDDAKYSATWGELTLNHRSWLAARELAGKVDEVVRQGLNIVAMGPTGTGKTLAAVLICRAAMQAGYTALKLDWSRFLDGLRDGYSDRTQEPEGKKLDRVCAADILLLDDIAAGGDDNKFSTARLEKVIGRRYDAQKPTILTANLQTNALHELLGDRAASRIHGRVIELVFNGQRFREQTERREVQDLVQSIWRGAQGGRA
ncbi:ATP-binding protein [Deinococcus geothermalis]|uniref:ATP-binding protein n=1 Tax=Deinococcus geothermalis TaxID=68909 RepID=UPI0023526DA6|nr:ATP-binding protein [Deinococcus geothermalis]